MSAMNVISSRVAETRRMSAEANAHAGRWPVQRPPLLHRLRSKRNLVKDHDGGCHTLYGFGPQARCPKCSS
jgi:hypothetical protein